MRANSKMPPAIALCLAGLTALAIAQTGKDQEPIPRNPDASSRPATDQQGTNLAQASETFKREVNEEAQRAARELGVRIEERGLLISIAGDKGLIAGAATTGGPQDGSGSGAGAGQGDPKKPGDPASGAGAGQSDPKKPGDPASGAAARPSGSNADVEGVILLSGAVASSHNARSTPGSPQGSDPNRPDERTPADAKSQQGAGGTQAYKVRCKAGSQRVELLDESGQVAMSFPLLTGGDSKSARPVEAGAPREPGAGEEREDPNQGGGTEPRNPPQGGDQGRMPAQDVEWSAVYASVVCGLLHGGK